MTTLYYTHPDCKLHITPSGHPEQVARLDAIEKALGSKEFSALARRDAPKADPAELERGHPPAYIEKVQRAIPASGFARLDADTHVSAGSFQAALRAIGAVEDAVKAVIGGEATNAFVACRPPGHHAEKQSAMGFCLFGNVAIGAKYALDELGLERVAILDFDVHHGNGTQDLLWEEARVRFASTHQMPLYPGTGEAKETGAAGNVINRPLAPQSTGEQMRQVWGGDILPQIEDFAPQLILISAGFDAHAADPLAQLQWQTEDYTWLTGQITSLAERVCKGRIVSTLEGGYDLSALEKSVAAHVRVLMGS